MAIRLNSYPKSMLELWKILLLFINLGLASSSTQLGEQIMA